MQCNGIAGFIIMGNMSSLNTQCLETTDPMGVDDGRGKRRCILLDSLCLRKDISEVSMLIIERCRNLDAYLTAASRSNYCVSIGGTCCGAGYS